MIRDLEESEEQFQTAVRSHMMNIEVLINLNDNRMQTLEKKFQEDLMTLQTSFHEEKNEITIRYKLEKKELAAIIETIEKEEQDRESDVSTIKSSCIGPLYSFLLLCIIKHNRRNMLSNK